jgi:hypothetical protein
MQFLLFIPGNGKPFKENISQNKTKIYKIQDAGFDFYKYSHGQDS